MQISGIIEKVYDYDFGTGDISMDILSDGKVIRCTGISGRFQAEIGRASCRERV